MTKQHSWIKQASDSVGDLNEVAWRVGWTFIIRCKKHRYWRWSILLPSNIWMTTCGFGMPEMKTHHLVFSMIRASRNKAWCSIKCFNFSMSLTTCQLFFYDLFCFINFSVDWWYIFADIRLGCFTNTGAILCIRGFPSVSGVDLNYSNIIGQCLSPRKQKFAYVVNVLPNS